MLYVSAAEVTSSVRYCNYAHQIIYDLKKELSEGEGLGRDY
jgi:hypothetical protein